MSSQYKKDTTFRFISPCILQTFFEANWLSCQRKVLVFLPNLSIWQKKWNEKKI